MRLLWMILGGLIAAAIVFFLARRGTTRSEPSAASLWKRLHGLTHDPAVSERLVTKERERSPHRSEAHALRIVIRRLERDRR